jgi:AcrR family transcriptional regulator
VEAAAQVFSREGLSATTDRIAQRAGFSIGTLYQYFPDKGALLHAVAERHVANATQSLNALFHQLRAEPPPFDTTIRVLLQVVVGEHQAHPQLHSVMHRLFPGTARDLEVMRDLEEHIVNEVAFHLKRCDRGGDDVELTAKTIVTAIDAHVHRVMSERGFSVDQLAALVTALAPPR